MPSSAGAKQEKQLFDYLRFQRGCVEVIEGDQAVSNFLGMQGTYKCGDALGLHPPLNSPGPRRVNVAESKGTDMNSAVEQLGNAAAGVFQRFGRETRIDLLVLVPALQQRPGGAFSPGHGFRAEPLKTGLNKFALQEWMEGPPVQAKPKVTYPAWITWSAQVSSLRITVLVLKGPAA
jgi:hypothetical protein